jgi:PAS domain S-box-containing protein
MIGLNEQIEEARNYAESIVANIREPLLMLDKNLRVKTANQSFYKTFKVNEKETENVLIYDLGNKQWDIPELRNLLEKILPEKSIIHDFEVTHSFQNIGELIMLLNAREVINRSTSEKLILVSIEDITERKKAQTKVEESEHRYHNMIYSSPSMIAIFKGEDMIIEIANDAIIHSWGKGKDVIGKPLLSILPEIVEQGFDKLLLSVYKTGKPVRAFEVPVSLLRNGIKELIYYNFVYQAQRNINGDMEGIAVIANEVTPQALANIHLKESEERFRTLANNVPIHIFNIEPNEEASTSYWNKNWLDYTGQSFEKAIGNSWSWSGIVHPDDVQGIMESYLTAFEKREPYFLPAIKIKRYDDIYRWHSVQANPRYLPNGDFIGYIGISFDIHEQKLAQDALKQSEEYFRSMSDLMPAKISNASADGNVTYYNKHWLDFTGYTFEELKDLGYLKIMHPDEVEDFELLFQKAAETGTDLVMEMRFKNKEGNYIWHLNIVSPVKDINGVPTMWIGVTTEMQHQVEQRELLEIAVLNRTSELQKANEALVFEGSEKEKRAEELVKINKELESFAFISSHDLQEPLRKIQTFTNLLVTTEKLSETGKDYFRRIEDTATRMRTLIDDLLSFSRLNTSERKFKITNLNTIIDTVKADFNEIIDEKKAIIEVAEICEVKIIEFQFRQLMQNLISNALKFSKTNVPPHILIKSRIVKGSKQKRHNLDPAKNYCHISVADNGIGFEEEYNEKIFDVFQRLHSKEQYAGTGIGLAIVKKIVENHEGEITVLSKVNKGTTFDIYLPAD